MLEWDLRPRFQAQDKRGQTQEVSARLPKAVAGDAERGWSEAELDAKYGWTGGRQAAVYTREMNRERLSVQATRRSLREQALKKQARTLEGGAGIIEN